jgi:hypothetical protein
MSGAGRHCAWCTVSILWKTHTMSDSNLHYFNVVDDESAAKLVNLISFLTLRHDSGPTRFGTGWVLHWSDGSSLIEVNWKKKLSVTICRGGPEPDDSMLCMIYGFCCANEIPAKIKIFEPDAPVENVADQQAADIRDGQKPHYDA